MEDLSVFIVIVVLVVSILQMILLFKIWQMTNDTAKIRETVSNMKATVDGILYSQVPEEKRIRNAFNEVFHMLWSQNIIKIKDLPSTEPERTEELNKKLVRIFGLNNRMFSKVLDKYVVTSVYRIEQLQSDVVNEYQKKIAELLESSK